MSHRLVRAKGVGAVILRQSALAILGVNGAYSLL